MQLVLLIPIEGANLPGFGGGIPAQPGHPSTGPVYPPGHPSAGLPIAPGHPANRPPNVPPNVIWPPSNPARPDNSLPPFAGTKPIQPPTAGTKPVDPGAALPAGASLVLVYNAEAGWQGAVVDASGATKPVAPAEPK